MNTSTISKERFEAIKQSIRDARRPSACAYSDGPREGGTPQCVVGQYIFKRLGQEALDYAALRGGSFRALVRWTEEDQHRGLYLPVAQDYVKEFGNAYSKLSMLLHGLQRVWDLDIKDETASLDLGQALQNYSLTDEVVEAPTGEAERKAWMENVFLPKLMSILNIEVES